MKVSRQVTVRIPCSLDGMDADTAPRVLNSNGFRDIAVSPNYIQATRGSYWATLFIPGDGRRWYHTLVIDSSFVTYTIDTWWAFFTRADEEVFETEGEALIDQLSGREPNRHLLAKATCKRRFSDFIVLLCIIAIGIGAALAITVLALILIVAMVLIAKL